MRELIFRAQRGESGALEQLVKENSGLVYSAVKRFTNRGQTTEDLYQVGCIGLMKAVWRFDCSLKVQFSTYAFALILGEIKQFLRDDGMIKISRYWKTTAQKAVFLQETKKKETGVEWTPLQLAEQIGVSSEDLILAMEAQRQPKALDITLAEDACSVEWFPLNELIDHIALEEALGRLEHRERKIIFLRYFRRLSQTETGSVLGFSQPQISRMEKKILKKLKEYFD